MLDGLRAISESRVAAMANVLALCSKWPLQLTHLHQSRVNAGAFGMPLARWLEATDREAH